jgi:hypothetical protein
MIVFWVITPYRIISLFHCYWKMCCVHLQSNWIWFRWKMNWVGGGNGSITQKGYEDCCGSELWNGKRGQTLYHASSVNDQSCQSFYIINPFPSIHVSLCLNQIVTLKMDTAYCSEALKQTYNLAQCNNTQDYQLSNTSCGSLNTFTNFYVDIVFAMHHYDNIVFIYQHVLHKIITR